MNIVICASMAFAKEMSEVGLKLRSSGNIVSLPPEIHGYLDPGSTIPDNAQEKLKLDIIKTYYNKIKECDAILVLNYEKKGVAGYIGANTLIEMAFAYALEKKIFLLHPIPVMDYADEIKAMKPLIISGDLSNIS